ncbi:MAG: hypothetical protein KAG99_05085, partial [Bacteroidales bacterium]|nr:hypothetical protein [Bacteroidales bacterium]
SSYTGRVLMVKNMNTTAAFIKVICSTSTIIAYDVQSNVASVNLLQGDMRRYTSDGTYWYESN